VNGLHGDSAQNHVVVALNLAPERLLRQHHVEVNHAQVHLKIVNAILNAVLLIVL